MARRLKASFRALCEDGQEVTINEYRTVRVLHRGGGHPPAEVEGSPYYQTENGDPVNPLPDGRYEVIPTYAINADLTNVICTRATSRSR